MNRDVNEARLLVGAAPCCTLHVVGPVGRGLELDLGLSPMSPPTTQWHGWTPGARQETPLTGTSRANQINSQIRGISEVDLESF